MKKIMRKSLAIFSLVIVSASLVQVAFASTYYTSFSFSVALRGTTRYFDGQNLAFNAPSATSSPYKSTVNKNYSAALYRDGWWDTYIGTVTLPRDASGTAKWSNVGSGNYYIYLSKANDGITLTDNNVKIYNY